MEDEIEDGSGEREKLACGTRAEGAPDSVDAVEWNRQTRTRTSGGRRVLNEVYSKAELKKREAFILSQRDHAKATRRAQAKAIKATARAAAKETQKFEADLSGAGTWDASQRSVELARLGIEDCDLIDSKARKRPRPEDINHPALLGYFLRRRSARKTWDSTVHSPVFFGVLSVPLTRSETSRSNDNLSALKGLANGVAFRPAEGKELDGRNGARPYSRERCCLMFPLAPVTRGGVRQRLREVGETYDRAGVVHPSCFGLVTIPDTQDCQYQSPVFFGYTLARNSLANANAQERDKRPTREDFISYRPGQSCPVCLVGKPGCPCCWDFPEGCSPNDFAYVGPPFKGSCRRESFRFGSPRLASPRGSCESMPPALSLTPRDGEDVCVELALPNKGRDVSMAGTVDDKRVDNPGGGKKGQESKQRMKSKLHTDLTTTTSISLYHRLEARTIRIFIKVIPCGTVTCIWMDISCPVSYLYDLWRMNAAEGISRDVFMFLPTTAGQWSLDNQNLPETDTTLGVHTGNLPLSTYNLTTAKSTAVVLCTTFFSRFKTKKNIERYLVFEIGVGGETSMEIFNHLVGCPKHPEDDPIQKSLCSVMEEKMRLAQQKAVDEDGPRAELSRLNNLLFEAEKARKESAIAVKRRQVAYGSKESRTGRRTIRRNKSAANTFQSVSTESERGVYGSTGRKSTRSRHSTGATHRPSYQSLESKIDESGVKLINKGGHIFQGVDSGVASSIRGSIPRLKSIYRRENTTQEMVPALTLKW
ncbi:unnamed protein product [Ascophyllum nodosum]